MLPITSKPYSAMLLLLLLPVIAGAAEDPCTPNPCGENTRCAATFSGLQAILSCECLAGFTVPTAADPADGCVSADGSAPAPSPAPATSTAAPRPALLTTTAAPAPRELGERRLQAGRRPGQLARRVPAAAVEQFQAVDTPDLFPDG